MPDDFGYQTGRVVKALEMKDYYVWEGAYI